MKRLLIMIVLVILFTGCNTNALHRDEIAYSDNDADIFRIRNVRTTSNLHNAIEWGIDGNIVLDEVVNTVKNNNETTTSYIMYPSKWPSEYLADYIPEYLGQGYMYILITTGPSLYLSNPEKSEVVSLSIYEYSVDNISSFVDELSALNFLEVSEHDYPDDVQYALENNLIDGFSKYTTDKCTVQILLNHDDIGAFLQLTVIMHDRIDSQGR